jgi:hypothetical protein
MSKNMVGEPKRRASEEVWRRTLSQIPTVYGRLSYLSQLRSPNTGLYEHHGLTLLFGEQETDHALRDSHEVSFQEWLSLRLEEQAADLGLYISDQPTDRLTLVENWLRLAPYRNLSPASASETEKLLFLSDIETLLRALKSEWEGAASDRNG